ncbi:MAG: HTTM domain-containing protein [Aeromicrobium sp.]
MPQSRPSNSVTNRLLDDAVEQVSRFEAWFLHDKRALHGLSLSRILAGFAVLGMLVTNFSYRSITFGAGSSWMQPIQQGTAFFETKLVENLGATAFTLFYLLAMLLAVLYIVGWRTKIVGPLMLIGWIAIIESGAFLGDQGDNVLRVGLILIMFAETSEHWSFDARRRRKAAAQASGSGPANLLHNIRHSRALLPAWFSNTVHNLALVALAFQLVLIYISAGMFKTQGPLWQHGTALYYPLQLPQYEPIPWLTDLFTHYGVVVGISTYMAVFIQLFFAPLLLNRITRRIALTFVILLHLGIAVLMALPWFSLAMVAFDAIFVSASTYIAMERWLGPRLDPVKTLFWDVTDPIVDRLPFGSRSR